MYLKTGLAVVVLVTSSKQTLAFKEDHLGFGPQINRHQLPVEETEDALFQQWTPIPEYKSNSSIQSVGMEQVYWLTNTFLDLILREELLPASVNTSMVINAVNDGPEGVLNLVKDNWQDLLLQYIGLLTAVLVGILFAILLPLIGLIVCCCRCAGKCGAYPDSYYDKKSDSCKRFCTSVTLSTLVIVVMFGCACAFLCNQYRFNGMLEFPEKLTESLSDTDKYLKHTQESTKLLLVDNFNTLEKLVVKRLDEGTGTIKEELANKTGANAVSILVELVQNLGKVKRNLKDIVDDTNELDVKILQLTDGLSRSQDTLSRVLSQCSDSSVCSSFLTEFNIASDLMLTTQYKNIQFRLPGASEALTDISDLIENQIEEKVADGMTSFDSVNNNIDGALADVEPLVKAELQKFGADLKSYNARFQSSINTNFVVPGSKEIIPEMSREIFQYVYYVGLGMSGGVLLILMFYILGLFYGMCGNTPNDMYSGDCCDRSTGANLLATATYLTFLLSTPLLLLTTLHFILGAGLDILVCDSLQTPEQSFVFKEVDKHFLQPQLSSLTSVQSSLDLLSSCHQNKTLYTIAQLSNVYDVNNLKQWRQHYNMDNVVKDLVIRPLRGVSLLSRESAKDLQFLAKSRLTTLDLSRFKDIPEDDIIRMDMRRFVRKLRMLREDITNSPGLRDMTAKLNNEIIYLENMMKVAEQVKVTLRHLKEILKRLEENMMMDTDTLSEDKIGDLVRQANAASDVINSRGEQILRDLTVDHVQETLGLVDTFVNSVVTGLHRDVGYCAPVSNSYNATVVALCDQMVQPFNGFWASIGWCCVLYLPCVIISLSLTALYRKTEKYPGPALDVETQPLDSNKRRDNRQRGHRRTHSRAENFQRSERTSSRALPPLPGEERPHSRYRNSRAEQPPRYSSNPSLNMSHASAPPASSDHERDRPPPYYSPKHH